MSRCRHALTPQQESRKNGFNNNGSSRHIYPSSKCPGKISRQKGPPNSNPLVRIQVSISNPYLPVRCKIILYSHISGNLHTATCTMPNHWDLPHMSCREAPWTATLRPWSSNTQRAWSNRRMLRPCRALRHRPVLWAKRETETRIPKGKIT